MIGSMDAQLAALLLVPPAMLGPAPQPKTREDAARIRLAYIEAVGLSPYDADTDVALLAAVENVWQSGIVDRHEAHQMLRPLRESVDPLGEISAAAEGQKRPS